MKNMFSVLAITVLAMGLFAVPAMAMVKTGSRISVEIDETVEGDFFAAGDEVIIEGTVNGDVYVGANRLTIARTAMINGDVIAGATNIEILGTVTDDVRVGGNNISLIGATVGDSLTVGGNELRVDRDTTIGGGLIFGGRLLSLAGDVGRGVVTGNQDTRITSGTVTNTVRIAANNITIDETATIDGDVEYRSDTEAVINGTVTGEVIRGEGGGLDLNLESTMKWVAVGFTVWAFLAAAIIGGVMLLLMPKVLNKAHGKFMKKPWATLGWGALVTLATIPAAILLFVTVFGIPLALVLLVLWGLAIYFAKFFVAHTLGFSLMSYLHKNSENYTPRAYPALLIGLVIYYGLRMLPGVGMLVRIATTFVGMGMIIGLYSRPKKSAKKA